MTHRPSIASHLVPYFNPHHPSSASSVISAQLARADQDAAGIIASNSLSAVGPRRPHIDQNCVRLKCTLRGADNR